MSQDVYDLKKFYNGRGGRLVRRFLSHHIQEIWPDIHGLRIMGYGYAVPYLRSYIEDAERVFNVMPVSLGVHYWPEGQKKPYLSLQRRFAI